MKKKKISKRFNLKEFIKNYNTNFMIPYYQRNYVWSLPENQTVLKTLYKEISYAWITEPDTEYDIETFSVCKTTANYIVDGQQRLTSLLIYLKKLTNHTKTNLNKYYYDENNEFIIKSMNSDNQLVNDLEAFLFPGQGKNANPNSPIMLAVDVAEQKINELINVLKESLKTQNPGMNASGIMNLVIEKLKEFENYILEGVTLTVEEFNDFYDALKHFRNINGNCIRLTEAELFYSFLSTLIYQTNSSVTIDNIKKNLDISQYTKKISEEELIHIFLEAYYQNSKNVKDLGFGKGQLGVGRWCNGYLMDILSDQVKGSELLNSFVMYSSDVRYVIGLLTGYGVYTNKNGRYKQIYLAYLLNKYSKDKYIFDVLLALFKNRNPYNSDLEIGDFYAKNGTIDNTVLEQYFKLANATYVLNYIGDNDLNVGLSKNTEKGISINAIINSKVGWKNIFNLYYPTEMESNSKIRNNKDNIHIILAIIEAYLENVYDPKQEMVDYLKNLSDTNQFTIEHLYSKKDFRESSRLTAWTNKNTFTDAYSYDRERSSFRNLSLLSRNANSVVGTNPMRLKLTTYQNTRSSTTPQLLTQSLACGSQYYNDKNIISLGLPDRCINLSQDQYTWDHSVNNDDYLLKVTEMAVTALFK